ncbi:hypothetical protein [Clostridium sp. Marseille-P3244]|uniref:hypothetical protein n=1 Tax=Clostridium sp. Marseille-P3244 TaxID=1871020 RepID=UPI000930F264|nr:hypothetical protein [Clostridium sp. Marseille-P3244]
MALGILSILFVGMSVISIIGLLAMYLLKGERAKAVAFYIMSVWGMAVSALAAVSLPTNYTGQRLFVWGLGFLSVIALILHIRTRSKSVRLISYILVTFSIIAGILKLFLI